MPAKCAVLGAVAAAHILVRCPVSGVAYTEVCWAAYVKDVALVSHCVLGLGRRTENGATQGDGCSVSFLSWEGLGDGTLRVHRLVFGVAYKEYDGLLT